MLTETVWDLAFFGRKDRSASLSTEISLSHERIMWWQRRMKKVIQHVELTFPGVPLWYRKLHRVGPVGGASCTSSLSSSSLHSPSSTSKLERKALNVMTMTDDWRHATKASEDDPNVKPETFSNFFTDVRIHQIREMQQQVVVSEGIPSFDFGEMWEGWQSYQQMVHPLLVSSSFSFSPSSPFSSRSRAWGVQETTSNDGRLMRCDCSTQEDQYSVKD